MDEAIQSITTAIINSPFNTLIQASTDFSNNYQKIEEYYREIKNIMKNYEAHYHKVPIHEIRKGKFHTFIIFADINLNRWPGIKNFFRRNYQKLQNDISACREKEKDLENIIKNMQTKEEELKKILNFFYDIFSSVKNKFKPGIDSLQTLRIIIEENARDLKAILLDEKEFQNELYGFANSLSNSIINLAPTCMHAILQLQNLSEACQEISFSINSILLKHIDRLATIDKETNIILSNLYLKLYKNTIPQIEKDIQKILTI